MPSDKLNFQQIIEMQPLIIGIGNTLRQDDGAGILLVENLLQNGYRNALVVHSTPENYIQKIAAMPGEARLWIDIVNWKALPGEYRIFNKSEIGYFAVSTHNYSLSVLVDFLRSFRDIPDYFLGIQPKTTNLGEGLSVEIEKTVSDISKQILQFLK